jgi:ABC-type multidrug transport system fused ATPase/permease subunit
MRYVWWLVCRQPWRVLRGGLIGTVWMVGLAVRPYLVARAIDDGLRAHDAAALLRWCAAIVAAGILMACLGLLRHRTMTFVREDATARSAAVVLRHLSRVGAVLPRRLAVGEVATVGGTDIGYTSHMLTMTGPGVGAAIAYAVVAVVLWSVSPLLALFVLLGVPAMVVLVGPLLRRLERAESAYRHEQGALTARSGDIVAGLRVLAGVGGRGLFARRFAERSGALRATGYRVGAVNSWIEAVTITVPGLFLAAVVWLSARMAAAGEITIGEMVAVYGYVAILTVPVWFLLEGSHQLIRGRVAARRIVALLAVVPDTVGEATPAGPASVGPADLHDMATGLTVPAGRLLGVAAADPAEAGALADRLGRYVRGDVTWGGTPLAGLDLAEVRARILVAEHESFLFAGTVRDVLRAGPPADDAGRACPPADDAGRACPPADDAGRACPAADDAGQACPAADDAGRACPPADDARIRAALRVASAEDVVDALPAGLDSPLGAQARTLSGGERQRLRLARAVLVGPEVLILLDPTSAVDAHTETRIAQRLRAVRAGLTTVVLTTSPLLLAGADTVALVSGGRVVARGTHADLLDREPRYRALVSRDTDLDDLDEFVNASRGEVRP